MQPRVLCQKVEIGGDFRVISLKLIERKRTDETSQFHVIDLFTTGYVCQMLFTKIRNVAPIFPLSLFTCSAKVSEGTFSGQAGTVSLF